MILAIKTDVTKWFYWMHFWMREKMGNVDYTLSDENRMRELLQLLTEPSLLPMHRAIDSNFYEKYFTKG